jgi:hypothetical protein
MFRLPAIGYRQWVLSFQGPLAVRLGYDTDLLAAVCEKLARALMQDLRRAVKRRHGIASVTPLHAGVMVAVQRFRSDLGLYVHLHCLATDGVFEDFGEADSAESTDSPESKAPRRIGWPASSPACSPSTSWSAASAAAGCASSRSSTPPTLSLVCSTAPAHRRALHRRDSSCSSADAHPGRRARPRAAS